MRSLALLGLAAVLPAQAVLVYDNGPLVTHPGAGPAGQDVSRLQNVAPYNHNVYGFGAQGAAGNRMSDNFTVNAVMQIDQIEVFGYATTILTPNATAVFLAIYDTDPSLGGTLNNLLNTGLPPAPTNLVGAPGYTVANTMTNTFRELNTGFAGNRQLQSMLVTLPATLTLTTGTYWFQYSYTGPNFVPPTVTPNVADTGDSKQLQGNVTWVNAINAIGGVNPDCGQAFKFYGPASAFPGAINALGGGCSTASFVARGSPVTGGYLHTELSNVNPLVLGFTILGLSDPNASLIPICGCTAHASLDVLLAAPMNDLEVPLTGSLAGVQLFTQGATLDIVNIGGVTACNVLGIQFDFTDAFEFRLALN